MPRLPRQFINSKDHRPNGRSRCCVSSSFFICHPAAWSSLQYCLHLCIAIAAKNLGNSLAALVAGFGTAGKDTNRIMLCDPCAGTLMLATVDFLYEVVRRVRCVATVRLRFQVRRRRAWMPVRHRDTRCRNNCYHLQAESSLQGIKALALSNA
jgi:hypothetical protein